jgi:uncharacterized protein (DUF1800 family)
MKRTPSSVPYLTVFALVALLVFPALQGAQKGAQMAADRELTADQQVTHVLSRLSFGARPGDVQRVRAMGVDQWIDEQLHPERITDDLTDTFMRQYQSLELAPAQLVVDYPPPQQLRQQEKRLGDKMTAADSARMRQMQQESQRVINEIESAKVSRAVLSERQLQEVMVDFWENHFSVFARKGPIQTYLASYDRDVIRPNALGKFRDLLGAVATSPAMLYYLDNWQSSADSGRPTLLALGRGGRGRAGALTRPGTLPPPSGVGTAIPQRGRGRGLPVPPGTDPNMIAQQQQLPQRRGRGLNENYARELMELHTLGVDGGYTQQDVINVARALTGWTITNPQQGGAFVFRPETHDAGPKLILGVAMPAGRGIEEGQQVLDMVAKHPSTAKFIATKLVRRFVSDTPPAGLVDRAAKTFAQTDGDIREVLRTIITSPEFFSQQAFHSKLKTPFELVVSAVRALNGLPDASQRTVQLVARLGQPIFGKETPNGYPDVADAWMNTGAILNRINFGVAVAANQVPGVTLDRWPSAAKLRNAAREQQVEEVIATLLNGAASPETRAVLMNGENPLAAKVAAADTTMVATDAMAPRRLAAAGRAAAAGRGAQVFPPGRGGGNGGGGRAGRGAGAQLPPPQLQGLAQVIGLAIGSPEFQRR